LSADEGRDGKRRRFTRSDGALLLQGWEVGRIVTYS
jgi:hypothetical protein